MPLLNLFSSAQAPDESARSQMLRACYAELKNVGHLSADKVEKLSATLCDAIAKALALPRDRIYIEFTNADGALWGFDGGTFG